MQPDVVYPNRLNKEKHYSQSMNLDVNRNAVITSIRQNFLHNSFMYENFFLLVVSSAYKHEYIYRS